MDAFSCPAPSELQFVRILASLIFCLVKLAGALDFMVCKSSAKAFVTSWALRGAGIVGSAVLFLPVTPALADGGAGASNGGISGGAGGTGFVGNPGSPGSDAPGGTDAAGGGGGGAGGGAGGRGGNSGLNAGGPGGAGGTSTAAGARDGSDGQAPTNAAAGGGGGGGGYNGNGLGAANVTGAGDLTGGKGGDGGGDANTHLGGGGGAGGYGGVVTSATTSTYFGTITGGNGGNGGQGTVVGGNGGDGGAGLLFTTSGATLTLSAGSITGGNGGSGGASGGSGGNGGNGGAGIVGADLTVITSGAISGGAGGLGVSGGHNGADGNAITFTSGNNVLELQSGYSFVGNVVDQTNHGTLRLGGPANSSFDVSGIGAPGQFQGFSAFEKTGTSTWTLTGTTAATTPWTLSQGTLSVSSDSNLGSAAGALTFNGGILQVTGTSFNFTARSIVWGPSGGGFDIADPNNFFFVTQSLTGTGGLTKLGAGTLGLLSNNTYSGATNVNDGVLVAGVAGAFSPFSAYHVAAGASLVLGAVDQSVGSLWGAGNVFGTGTATLITGGDGTTSTFSGILADGPGTLGLTVSGSGSKLVLTGLNNTYSGATTVTGGATLEVDGAISGTSVVTVNAASTLTGAGTIQSALPVTIAGGATLTPGLPGAAGSSLNLIGNLSLNPGSAYSIYLNTTSTFANVTGSATLTGSNVIANFAPGGYVSKTYMILAASGGFGGTTFSGLSNAGLPSGASDTLSYDATHAYLNLTPGFAKYTGLSINQQNVANALSNYFNANGAILMSFFGLQPAGLTQISGEIATGSQQATFNAMNQFMDVMTDPFIVGRNDPNSAGGSPSAYAADAKAAGKPRSGNEREAYAAMYGKAPAAASFEQRWSVWAAGFGGTQTTDGNGVIGSNATSSSLYATAVGADYRLSPNTLAGFALAGGGTNFSVNGLGDGRSDLFQAGAFVRHTIGATYLTAALAYGWQDISTNRDVAVAGLDLLHAEFNANAWSGRVETGNRFVAPIIGGVGLTPYVAGQFTTFDLPAYAEQALAGGANFALNYAAKSVTDVRGELGLRVDKSFATQFGVLTLRSRVAWAHDYDPDRSIAATFQTLPGASFVVNGAAQASDSALTTASLEMKWMNGWSAAATFEGEFSNVTTSYAGKGVVRYGW